MTGTLNRREGIIVDVTRWSYKMLAAHLGVSKRTLIRYVVTGSLPSPTYMRGQSYWGGEDLDVAKNGPSLPGTYAYVPAPKVTRQRATIFVRQETARQAAEKAAQPKKKPAKKPAKGRAKK